MYQAQPSPSPSGGYGTITFNCTDNPLECVPQCPGGNCVDYAAPPPPPPYLPRAPVAVDHTLPVRLLLTVSLLSAFLFLSLALATLILYRRRRVLRRRRRSATAPLPHGEGFGDDGGDEEAGGGGGGVVHHVWYIRTVGLDEAAIASIATVEYRGVGSGGDCAVCLGEFSDGELVRLLPRCSHPFHAPCIDTWLRAHVNCPICRSTVVVPSNVLAAATDADAEGEETEEHQVFDEMSPSESLGDDGSEDTDASSDTQSEDTEAAAEENGSAMPKPIRRSASMDSPLFLVAVPGVHQHAAVQPIRKLPSSREMRIFKVKDKEAAGTSSSSCQAGKLGIGRSMSSSGRAFFFSRSVHSTGTALPL